MKKRLASFVLILAFIVSLTTPAMASSDTGEYKSLWGTLEADICTATFIDPEKGGGIFFFPSHQFLMRQ